MHSNCHGVFILSQLDISQKWRATPVVTDFQPANAGRRMLGPHAPVSVVARVRAGSLLGTGGGGGGFYLLHAVVSCGLDAVLV